MRTLSLTFLVAMLALAGCTREQGPTSRPAVDNTLPRYGDPGRETIWGRTPPEQRSRLPEQSVDASDRGWTYARQHELDTAMRRFNQAWLLNPDNAEALWGMAIVQFQRGRDASPRRANEAAIRFVDESLGLFADASDAGEASIPFLTDRALATACRGGLRKWMGRPGASADFNEAEKLLRQAENLGEHPHVDETWAALEHYRGNPAKAAEYERKARQSRDRAGR